MKDLRSPIEEVVLDTVDAIAKKGDVSMVKPLLNTLLQNESVKVRSMINQTLSNVKDKGMAHDLFEALEDDEFVSMRQSLLSLVWNAQIPITNRLELLIGISMNSGFQEQFEILTILENNTSELTEEEVMNSLLEVRDHIQMSGDDSEVMQEILQKLQIMERFD